MILLLKTALVLTTIGASGNAEFNHEMVNGRLQADPTYTYNSPYACTKAMVPYLNLANKIDMAVECATVGDDGFIEETAPLHDVTISHGGYSTTRQPDSVIELRLNRGDDPAE